MLKRISIASWLYIVGCPQLPDCHLNIAVCTHDVVHVLLPTYLLYTGSIKTAKPQSIQPLPMPVAVKFSENQNIANAFTKLSAVVTDIIQHTNFSRLQRSCIERARTPEMLHKSNEIIPFVKEADTFDRLCSMLADTTYWNFLDIRMMEAMATASMIPVPKRQLKTLRKHFIV